MEDYRDNKQYIGTSDVAAVIFVGCTDTGLKSEIVHMGEDDSYLAYIVNDPEIPIPDHYTLTYTFKAWLSIYDDNELANQFKADTIQIYRAGQRGIIIRLLD